MLIRIRQHMDGERKLGENGFSKSIRSISKGFPKCFQVLKGFKVNQKGFKCFKRVSKYFKRVSKGFETFLKGFKTFQSISKGFPKGFQTGFKRVSKGFQSDLKPPKKYFLILHTFHTFQEKNANLSTNSKTSPT